MSEEYVWNNTFVPRGGSGLVASGQADQLRVPISSPGMC